MSNLVVCTKLDTFVSTFYYHSVDIFSGVSLVPGIIIHTVISVSVLASFINGIINS